MERWEWGREAGVVQVSVRTMRSCGSLLELFEGMLWGWVGGWASFHWLHWVERGGAVLACWTGTAAV